MSEKDYAPLSAACVRALNDKIYDKRKAAAQEIEKMVKDFAANNKKNEIRRLLKVLGQDFATSQNAHSRKGGLIGLAAIAIALGKDTSEYTEGLIRPILANFSDSDLRVRYYACESLYNVVKVARSSVLPHFTEVFSALSKLAADPDQSVKTASEHLDRLLKDIVTESATFDLISFMPLLRERLYATNPFARQFIINWVAVLDAVPDIDIILFLPEILDGLFLILEDSTLEIKKMCETVLDEFLHNIKQDPSRVDFAAMINNLVEHAQAVDELLQFTAITWIKEFVTLSNRSMLPYASGILGAVLPCLAYNTDARKNIKVTAQAVNCNLMSLITSNDDTEKNIEKEDLDLPSIVKVFSDHLVHTSVQTKIAVLKWIFHLHTNIPNRMTPHIETLFPVLLKVLCDSSDEVVEHDLEVLAEIISQRPINYKPAENNFQGSSLQNPYFSKFIVSLLDQFRCDRHLLQDRGSFIIRQMCILISPEDIYRTLAEILKVEENLKFATVMVENLNTILLTSSELFDLRSKLKDLKTEESCKIFCCLYETWCHSPVATIALCFLTQNYEHVCELIRIFGSIEITVELLTEIDKLIQLLESPIFTYLRLELLNVSGNGHLVQALYGLLMLLPQTDAFHTLRHRLECIPKLQMNVKKLDTEQMKNFRCQQIDFSQLVQHFIKVQDKHKLQKNNTRTVTLLKKGAQNIYIDNSSTLFN